LQTKNIVIPFYHIKIVLQKHSKSQESLLRNVILEVTV